MISKEITRAVLLVNLEPILLRIAHIIWLECDSSQKPFESCSELQQCTRQDLIGKVLSAYSQWN